MSLLKWGVCISLIIASITPQSAANGKCPKKCPKNETVGEGLTEVIENDDTICENVVENCNDCFTDSSKPWCQPIQSLLGQTEVLSTPPGQEIIQPPGCSKENIGACTIPPEPGRRRRGIDFHPKYVWHQDGTVRKRKQSCVTTKRVIHFVGKCGEDCYPVYCPLAGGHQFIDEVVCNIRTIRHRKKYQAFYYSQPEMGPCQRGSEGKKCSVAYSVRTYLVTNVEPQGWFGHCLFDWVPVWFKNLAVPTHCYCAAM